ncbi:hypothetical protein HKX48_006347 [Thoreauomyces humboldtii]|nr:hypothetical protein HKX48_006347 [Thoreauomyces humboldtii]
MSNPTNNKAPEAFAKTALGEDEKKGNTEDQFKALKAQHPGISDDEIKALLEAGKQKDLTADGVMKFGLGP